MIHHRKLRNIVTPLALVLFVSLVYTKLQAQTSQARGCVYLDTNGNDQRDAGEPGIHGVHVSNGLDVVATDTNGDYSIELPEERILFISKPDGYRVPLNEVNLPQFYYGKYHIGNLFIFFWCDFHFRKLQINVSQIVIFNLFQLW